MSRLRVLAALMTAGVVLAASQLGWASSITLISSGGGIYNYGLTLAPGEDVAFFSATAITLSGLSGVTGASVSSVLSGCLSVGSVSPASVIYAGPGPCGFIDEGRAPITEGALSVFSSTMRLGTINFSMQTLDGTVNGTTQGPAGLGSVPVPAPEPSSFVLVGAGVLGLVGFARRKWSRLT